MDSAHIITQEHINAMHQHTLERRRHREYYMDRYAHNQEVKNIIAELSENCDE